MGRASIVSDLGGGRYRISPVIDKTHALAEISRITDENTTIASRLTELSVELTAAENAVDLASDILRAAMINGEPGDVIAEKQASLRAAESELIALSASRSYLGLRSTANSKRIAWLEQETADPAELDAWCADLTAGISGEVGTIETGRRSTTPIIRPGSSAAYSASRDGILQPLASSTAAGVFYNAAMQPGAAVWKPIYRTGTASAINTTADTMTVTLDAVTIAGINCNQESVISDVPVEYMSCNALAFNSGDAVVVEFAGQEWASPKVIGFVHDPQPCELTQRVTCYLPTDDVSGAQPSKVLTYSAGWSAEAMTIEPAGTIDWSLGSIRLAWKAGWGRYKSGGAGSGSIYFEGVETLRCPFQVMGAALMESGGVTYCNVVARIDKNLAACYQKKYQWAVDLDTTAHSGGGDPADWYALGSFFVSDSSGGDLYPFHFSANGSECASVFGVTRDIDANNTNCDLMTVIRVDWAVGTATVTDEGTEPPGGYGSTTASGHLDQQHCELDAAPVVTYTSSSSALYRALLWVDYTAAGRVTCWQETSESSNTDMAGAWDFDVPVHDYECTLTSSSITTRKIKTTLGASVNIGGEEVTRDYYTDSHTDPLDDHRVNHSDTAHILAADLRHGVFVVHIYSATTDRVTSAAGAGSAHPIYTQTSTWADDIYINNTKIYAGPNGSLAEDLALSAGHDKLPLTYFYTCYASTSLGVVHTSGGLDLYAESSVGDAHSLYHYGGLVALGPSIYVYASEVNAGAISSANILEISGGGNSASLLGISSDPADNPKVSAVGVV